MPKTSLLIFWVLWLLTLLATLLGYQEFLQNLFGRNSAPTTNSILLWCAILLFALLVLGGSLYLKNAGQHTAAIWAAAAPLLLALPYLLYIAVVLVSGGKSNWR